MTVQEPLAYSGPKPSADVPTPVWWQSRSSEELQRLIQRGLQGGDMFFSAVAEMERRAKQAEAERSAQQEQAEKALQRRRKTILLAILMAMLLAAGVVFMIL